MAFVASVTSHWEISCRWKEKKKKKKEKKKFFQLCIIIFPAMLCARISLLLFPLPFLSFSTFIYPTPFLSPQNSFAVCWKILSGQLLHSVEKNFNFCKNLLSSAHLDCSLPHNFKRLSLSLSLHPRTSMWILNRTRFINTQVFFLFLFFFNSRMRY